MMEALQLSQSALAAFRRCERRFYLRFVRRLEWPAPLTGSEQAWERSLQRGEDLHLLIEQAALGMDAQALAEASGDAQLLDWWNQLMAHPPPQPAGTVYSELELTVPLGNHRLVARFDRLVCGDEAGTPFIHIFDWKTGTAQPPQLLADSWQTAIYRFVAVEASSQLTAGGVAVAATSVSFTYWQADAPLQPVLLDYDEAAHEAARHRLQAALDDIEIRLAGGEDRFARTADPEACRHCPYRSYCERGREPAVGVEPDEDLEEGELLRLDPINDGAAAP